MTWSLFLVQLLNGVQYGFLLFLMAAGLTLVFGIMSFVNLEHGSLYMMGAYFAAWAFNHGVFGIKESFLVAALVGVAGSFVLGVVLERVLLTGLYSRDHLDQVLATFGLILVFNEVARFVWGVSPYYMQVPKALEGTVDILGIAYPSYRFMIILVGAGVALGMYWLIQKTRIGMLIRAGASNATMIGALGVNIKLLNTLLFGVGAALAGVAGLMAGPILSVQPGMGEPILIVVLVVIVTGGIGSIRGAFYAALIVGVIDTVGRVFLPIFLREIMERSLAQAAGPAIASMLIYLLMASVLAIKPEGLFPVKNS